MTAYLRAVHYCVPETLRTNDDLVQPCPVSYTGQFETIDDVFADRAGQGQRQGKDHAHPSPKGGNVRVRSIDVLSV